jgi:IclR family pca regulon transcriptional regulator
MKSKLKKITKSDPGLSRLDQADEDHLFVNSVEKAFRVLTSFDESRRKMTLGEIVEITGLDKSAAQRFSHTLEKLGYLERDSKTKQLSLSVKTLTIGYRYLAASSLVERAAPYLMHLSKETEEAVNLTIMEGAQIVFISRLLSRHMLSSNIMVGTRLPAYCTAPGIAMLSHLPNDVARKIINSSELIKYTPSTITDPDTISRELLQSRERGYAITVEQIYANDISIAAPILNDEGLPVAALNIAVLTLRYKKEEAVERFAPLIMAAAQALSTSTIRKISSVEAKKTRTKNK